MAGFLGLSIKHSVDKKIVTLTQVGLIDRILRVGGMYDSNPKSTHTVTILLCKDYNR